jgi:hypothetical protein
MPGAYTQRCSHGGWNVSIAKATYFGEVQVGETGRFVLTFVGVLMYIVRLYRYSSIFSRSSGHLSAMLRCVLWRLRGSVATKHSDCDSPKNE